MNKRAETIITALRAADRRLTAAEEWRSRAAALVDDVIRMVAPSATTATIPSLEELKW